MLVHIAKIVCAKWNDQKRFFAPRINFAEL